jgi:hypothetical protein
MMGKLDNERVLSEQEKNQALSDKARLENEWAVDPNSVKTQTLFSQVGAEQTQAEMLTEQFKRDEALRNLMRQKPPSPGDLPETDVDSSLDSPFPKHPKN